MSYPKTKLTQSQLEDLKNRHKAGEYINNLAREYHIRTQRVIDICGRRTLKYESDEWEREGMNRKCTDEEIAAIRNDYYFLHKTVPQIAEERGIGKSTLNNYIYGYTKPESVSKVRTQTEVIDVDKLKHSNKLKRKIIENMLSKMHVGNMVNLIYKKDGHRTKNKKEHDELKVRHGKVIQVEQGKIFVQDVNRQYLKIDIKTVDILDRTVIIQMAG